MNTKQIPLDTHEATKAIVDWFRDGGADVTTERALGRTVVALRGFDALATVTIFDGAPLGVAATIGRLNVAVLARAGMLDGPSALVLEQVR